MIFIANGVIQHSLGQRPRLWIRFYCGLANGHIQNQPEDFARHLGIGFRSDPMFAPVATPLFVRSNNSCLDK
jgi:hypothetical protein